MKIKENEYKRDEEYLDKEFPKEVYYKGVKKPESQLRGQAMVLLALAREEGGSKKVKDILKIVDECADKTDIWDNERWKAFRRILKKELEIMK